eukprot:7452193-Heterocapsa_arctica.AAC.1
MAALCSVMMFFGRGRPRRRLARGKTLSRALTDAEATRSWLCVSSARVTKAFCRLAALAWSSSCQLR